MVLGVVAVCSEARIAGGRLKVARGRSWQPEIGMEHASRGRRSGNKGVGARWRGRFRIFAARHRSRLRSAPHAENSGMTMLFFSLEVAPPSHPVSVIQHWGSFTLEYSPTNECPRPSSHAPPRESRCERIPLELHAKRKHRLAAEIENDDGAGVAVCFEGCCGSGNAKRSELRGRASFPSGAWDARHQTGGLFHTLGSGTFEKIRGVGFALRPGRDPSCTAVASCRQNWPRPGE